jgi:HlyD family secretion protein
MARQQQDTAPATGKRIWIIIGGIIFAVLILAAFVSRRREIPVHAGVAEKSTITSSIQTNGKIEPINGFEAHSPFATTVKKVFVGQGAHVRAGQLILQLEDADALARAATAATQIANADANLNAVKQGGTREEVLTVQSDLARARADRDAAQRNLDALRRLQQKGAASAGEVADAENRFRTLQAQVELLEKKTGSRYSPADVAKVEAQAAESRASLNAANVVVEKANIRAPRDGMVYFLPVHEGQFVNAGDLLAQVADISKIQLRAFVDEPDIGKLQAGQNVNVTWDAQPGQVWQGKVTQVPTTVVTRGTRNVGEFTSIVDNSDERLLPNVNVNVNIVTAQHDNALTIPREAIHQDDGKRYVYQIVNGELKRRDVQTSLSNLTKMEITQGLDPNARVALGAVNGQPLKDGLGVRVVEE